MKIIITLLALSIYSTSFSQISQVKFTESTFENGMLYPTAVVYGSKEATDNINTNLLSQIQDLKEADFCIGQYGYVQKGAHIQIHIFCNCIDFDESQNRYFLYNVESGDAVKYENILNPRKKEDASKFLKEKTAAFINTNSIDINKSDLEIIDNDNLDAFKIVFKREGMDLWLKNDAWGKESLFISWGEMKELMKYNFL